MTQIERHRASSLAATVAAEQQEAYAEEWDDWAEAASTPTRRENALRCAELAREQARYYYGLSQQHDQEALRLALETVASECAILIAA